MDTISNGHEEAAPTRQRVFWAICVAVVAGTLLGATGAGGLQALQQVIIVVGLPFFVMGYLMIYTLLRALKEDAGERPPLKTKSWRRVLPPEEARRRRKEAQRERKQRGRGEEAEAPLLTKTDTAPRDESLPREGSRD
jgi:choline/glycine/proline betaine transport protein